MSLRIFSDALNNLQSPDFYLGMHIDGAPNTPPQAARLRRELSRWLAELDGEAIQRAPLEHRYEDIPTHEWTHEGWRIVFEPMPKGDRARANTSIRPIGLTMPMRARRLSLDETLRDGVAAKDRHGRLTLPLVIAIQIIEEFRIDKIDVMNGLLGPKAITFDAEGGARPGRVPNGAWISGTSSTHRTISAVMAWSTLEPWNFTRIEPIIVHNPYAYNPLPNDALPVAQNVVDHENGVLVEQPGVSMEDLLGLAKDWVADD